MNERYDIHGNAYRVKTTLDDGTVIAFPLYEDPETGDEMEGELQVIAVPLFDNSPRQKIDSEFAELSAKVAAARAELEGLRRDIRQTAVDGKARLAKLAQYDQLKRLEDFLDGKITHYVLVDWYPPKVISLADATCEIGDRDLRLLCLYGTPRRTLEWKLNRYSDGSGSSTHVFPCCGIEEAKEVVAGIYVKHFAGKSVDGSTTAWARRDWLDAADEAGVIVPAEYRAAVVAKEAEQRANEVKSLEAKLADLRKAGVTA